MPATRTPTAKAKVTGAAKKNPARFKDRNDPKSKPLGKPSRQIVDETQIEIWEAFKVEIPWLLEADRTLVEIAVNLRARLWSGGEVGVQALGQLRMCIAQMGGTPADRSKVDVPGDGNANPTDKYFN